MLANSKFNRQTLTRLLALAAVIAISVYIFSIRDQAEELARYGYPGVFLLAFMGYATVLLPAPAVLMVFSMGAVLNPYAVALVAGAGAALGELSGYLAGYSGQGVIERSDMHARLSKWMSRNGPLTVLLLAAVPNPFFDLAGLIAGALKMPVPRFLFWVWIGETLKMLFFALTGAWSLGFFK